MNGELPKYLGILAVAALMVLVVRWRRKSYRRFIEGFAEREICQHLRPALQALESRGHRVLRAGQRNVELPLEIHVTPGFDPHALAKELKLAPPVFVSERNVICCEEDFCEIHPVR